MELLYAQKFNKDVDEIRKEARAKKALLKAIEKIREARSIGELKGVRKIEGYQKYYRIKVGEYRLGIKATKNTVELTGQRDVLLKFNNLSHK